MPRFPLPCGLLAAALLANMGLAEKAKLVTYAKTYGNYEHVADPASPDFGTETFALAEGQFEPGDLPGDDLADTPFADLAVPLAQTLQSRGYRPAASADDADIVVVVHRGRTQPARDEAATAEARNLGADSPASMASGPSDLLHLTSGSSLPTNRAPGTERGGNLLAVARKLGYWETLQALEGARNHPVKSRQLDDVLAELAQDRYYIVLGAYDGRALRNQGRQVLLWEARFSFLATRKSFADRAGRMLEAASIHFGHNTPGPLDRRFVSLD